MDLQEYTPKCADLIKDKKFNEALEIANKILTKSPDNGDAINNKGCCLANLGNLESALECFEKIGSLANIAIVLGRMGQ